MRFTKMHGIGNDYIYIDCTGETVRDPEKLAFSMSRPHFGVGSDGLVLIERSDVADFRMRMFNSDGSQGAMCGNAARCVGRYVYERGLTAQTELELETKSGNHHLSLRLADGRVQAVQVDMGRPELRPEKIPVLLPEGQAMGYPTQVAGMACTLHCVSMGNPHCVVFVEDPDRLRLEEIGPCFENLPVFPDRVNTEFVQVIDRKHLYMRVWERGSGETLACGTGACAALVAAVLTGRAGRDAELRLRGGTLRVSWSEEDDHVRQEGPAAFVFDGDWPEGAE